ncbi:DUF488 domain-containing protein [Knoellia sp. LjRoot47]|uniref:DUF488 domain-containing protein n=1 Tax=Knoellia sp. LjRoot47 TaxID=3342330 RepID=UPI003ECCB3EA
MSQPKGLPACNARSSLNFGIVSVGYEGRDLADFVNLLVAHHVGTLADVRLNAISRRVGFSKTRLGQALADAGIEYVHLRCLGNPKENRERFRKGPLDEGIAHFRQVLKSAEAEKALSDLGSKASSEVIAVMCFEADHRRCHRDVVVADLRSRVGVNAVHV